MTRTQEEISVTHTTSKLVDFVSEWANEFYKAKKIEGVSGATQIFYKQQLGHFLDYCDAQVIERLDQLNTNVLRDYLVWLEENGHNPGGVHAAYRVLKTFLRWYEAEAEPDNWKNPITKIKAPKLAEDPLEPVEVADVFKMADVCDRSFLGWRDKAILLFLLDTGLRAGELLRLNQDDINLVTGVVLVKVGKGRKPRSVFIGAATRKVLRMYLKMRADTLPVLWVTEDQAGRLRYGALRVLVSRRSKAAGVDRPALHDFRRAFALNMLRNGVDIISLSRLMGHTSTKVLARYLHLVNDDLRESHAKGSPVDNLVSDHMQKVKRRKGEQPD